MLPYLLFSCFSSIGIILHALPTALLQRVEPNGAFVLLSEPVTCSPPPSSLLLFICLCLSPLRIPPLKLTIEVRRERHGFPSGRGVKGGAENKLQVFRRDSPHLNAHL